MIACSCSHCNFLLRYYVFVLEDLSLLSNVINMEATLHLFQVNIRLNTMLTEYTVQHRIAFDDAFLLTVDTYFKHFIPQIIIHWFHPLMCKGE